MDSKTFERNVTLGFKLLAGHYQGAITKDAIADLPRKSERRIPWGTLEFETAVNEVGVELGATDVFRYWRSWNLSLIEATSDAVAINFVLLVAHDWLRKGRPRRGSGQHDAFVKNAVTLLDRSIFEYVSGLWGGSGDSRIASNMEAAKSSPANWPAVTEERWQALLEEVIDRGELRGQAYTGKLDPRVVLLHYYRQVVLLRQGPNSPKNRVHADHIIPRKLFESEGDTQVRQNMNHITNIALLPADENVEKSGKRLVEIQSPWIMDQVAKFSDIHVTDFVAYSNTANSAALRAHRGPILKADLTQRRAALVADPLAPHKKQ